MRPAEAADLLVAVMAGLALVCVVGALAGIGALAEILPHDHGRDLLKRFREAVDRTWLSA